jgi:hypothetical protein
MSRYFSGLLAVSLFACGAGTEPGTTVGTGGITTSAGPQAEQRGARLKRVWLKASDETVTQAGYFDSSLQTICDFTPVGGASLCMPRDVYTLRADEWSSRYSTSSRALYTDPKCGTPDVALLSSYASCTKYGVVRVMPKEDARTYQSCGDSAPGPTYYAAKLVPAGTKIYEFGVQGGLCCSCAEYQRDADDVLVKFEPLSGTNTGLVSAELTVDP